MLAKTSCYEDSHLHNVSGKEFHFQFFSITNNSRVKESVVRFSWNKRYYRIIIFQIGKVSFMDSTNVLLTPRNRNNSAILIRSNCFISFAAFKKESKFKNFQNPISRNKFIAKGNYKQLYLRENNSFVYFEETVFDLYENFQT
jgi:hypothetical protein